MRRSRLGLAFVLAVPAIVLALPAHAGTIMYCGPGGQATIYGTPDDDTIYDQPGFNDSIVALRGNDSIATSDRGDAACGNAGQDWFSGQAGYMSGGPGYDHLAADGDGIVQVLEGGVGRDTFSPRDSDIVRGGRGDDWMRGQYPGDNGRQRGIAFIGGGGDDFIDSQDGAGTDSVSGGRGIDRCLRSG